MGIRERVGRELAAYQSRDTGDALLSLDDWAQLFQFGGLTYPVVNTSMGNIKEERIAQSANAALRGNSTIFALVSARVQVFSQVRFQWTRFTGSLAGDLFGTPDLKVLEQPWPGGATPDLLGRMELDDCMCGNGYIVRPRPDRLARLRPDFVIIVLGSQLDADYPADAPDVEIAGYAYLPRSGKAHFFFPNEVAHYAPMPDPDFQFLGMSWISACIRELQADSLMTEHKARYFTNAAPQPMDAKILTPWGWSTMGHMFLGQQVTGLDGKPHRVTGVFPQGEQDVYRVTFSDGAATECTADHLWQVTNAGDRKRGVTRTMTLAQMMTGGLRYKSGPAKWAVPLVEPVEFDEKCAQPMIDPYLLGALLGDGSLRGNTRGYGGPTLAAAAEDADEMGRAIACLAPATRRDRDGWSEFYFRSSDLRMSLEVYGLWGVLGAAKHVPEEYMHGSVEARIALLQGLLDTDGSVSARQPNLVRFSSTSWRLSEQVAELTRSLGGTAKITYLEPAGGKPQWQVTVKRLPAWITPFRLSRKADRYRPPSVGRFRNITGVEKVGQKQCQCIRVDVADSLYVTDDYVLTHNTPNLAIKFDPAIGIDMVRQFKALMEEEHKGVFNAWKTLYLGGGADVVPVGNNLREIELAINQSHGETKLAAAAGIPPSWVGFSEGLQGSTLNAGNFDSARRRMADGTFAHLWTSAATCLQSIVPPRYSPVASENSGGATLWYDARVPFMREDAGDLAKIQVDQSQVISVLVQQGFEPDSVVKAVANNDWSLLKHSGLVSVQLNPPGSGQVPGNAAPAIAQNSKAPATVGTANGSSGGP